MRVRIHRGAHEIGGNCVEVETAGARLVLDVGRPLTAGRDEHVPLPDVAGFGARDEGLVGVVITHAHQDHWGLAEQLPPGTPIFLGEATASILREAAFWSTGLAVDAAGYLRHRTPFAAGPFRITPFLNDDSAFDAYSLLIEAEGKRVFYTGDIRGHGRKLGIFEELLRKPPTAVDVLLMEGTHIRADVLAESAPITEDELEDQLTKTFRSTKGMVLTVYSAQNIDRLVTMYRAALKSDRGLVMDLYGASIAAATGNANIPRPGPEWPRIRVFVPQSQRVKVKRSGEFERVEAIKSSRIFEEELAADPARYVTVFSLQSGERLARAGCLDDASAVWSLWTGYLDQPSGKQLRNFLSTHAIPLQVQHTSGHASIADLQRLAQALAPGRVVPIHSFGAARFADYFDDAVAVNDGEWWDV